MIKNQYFDKTPEEVWSQWNTDQRYHFLLDHEKRITGEKFQQDIDYNARAYSRFDWSHIPNHVKTLVIAHVYKGQYKEGGLTPKKARQILHEGKVHGHPITEQQRKYFGAIASGEKSKQYNDGGEMTKYDIIREWIGEGYSDKDIESVYKGYEDSGESLDRNAKRVSGSTPEQFSENVTERVKMLFSEIQPGNWGGDLSAQDVKDILWGVVMANKHNSDFFNKGGVLGFKCCLVENWNKTLSFKELFTK